MCFKVLNGFEIEGLDSSNGNIQDLRDLIVLQLVIVPHDKDHPLPLGQPVQTDPKYVFKIRGNMGIDIQTGISPFDFLGITIDNIFLVLFPVFSIVIDAQVFGDLKKPVLKAFAFFKHFSLLIKPQKGVLNDIHGIFVLQDDISISSDAEV